MSDEDDDGSEVGSESAHPLRARLASIVPPHRVVGLREATLSIVAALAGPLLEDVEVTRGRLALGDEEVELDHRNGGEIEGARVLARWLARRSPAWRLIGLRYGDEEEDCAFACSSRAEAEAVRVLPVRWLWEPEPFLADPPPEVLRLGERELPVHFPILPDPSGGARARLRADHPTGDILLPRGAVVVARDEARGFCDVGATPARYGAFLLGSGARITLRVGGGAEAFGPLAAPIDVGLALGVGDVVELCDGRLVGVLLAAERSGSAGTFPAGAALVVDGDRFLP